MSFTKNLVKKIVTPVLTTVNRGGLARYSSSSAHGGASVSIVDLPTIREVRATLKSFDPVDTRHPYDMSDIRSVIVKDGQLQGRLTCFTTHPKTRLGILDMWTDGQLVASCCTISKRTGGGNDMPHGEFRAWDADTGKLILQCYNDHTRRDGKGQTTVVYRA
jgi:hypothetical protein